MLDCISNVDYFSDILKRFYFYQFFSMPPYLGDLEKTNILYELFEIPKEKRDESWKQNFLANVDTASFRCSDPQIIQGPDGFPYFVLYLPQLNKEFQCFVLEHMKDDFLLEKGVGVVIGPKGTSAEWIFSYGDIVNYHLTGQFYYPENQQNVSDSGETQVKVMLGQPAENYFPKAARAVLRNYLASFHVLEPKILLMIRSTAQGNLREVVFNLTPEMFESPEYYVVVMKKIGWFLPRHYIYSSVGSNSNFERSFMPL